MTAIDVGRVAALLKAGDAAVSSAERGRALEDLIAYLFELIPGITVTARNEMNAFAAEAIDIAFWNDGSPDGLVHFDHLVIVECKNWSSPIGYPEMAIFNDKLQSRGRPLGIMVAAKGITGDPVGLTAAHSVLARALGHGREILVITRAEIEQLTDTSELVILLKRKRAQLAVSGTIYQVGRGQPVP